MGESCSGQINFGIIFEEDFEFPWGDNLTDWWIELCGFKYQEGQNYERRRDFIDSHPCPVQLVNYCRDDECVMYLLALTSQADLSCSRGNPVSFDPSQLVVSPAEVQSLLDFCTQYKIDIGDQTPKWWLTSCSG